MLFCFSFFKLLLLPFSHHPYGVCPSHIHDIPPPPPPSPPPPSPSLPPPGYKEVMHNYLTQILSLVCEYMSQ